jgi:hypothetical protein
MYGRYDELVIELWGWDRLRTGRSEVRVKVDDVLHVRAAAPADLVSVAGERVLRAGSRRADPALVLDLADAADFDRIVLGIADAEHLAAELVQWGIGRLLVRAG